jgi:hypothetical protein
MRDVFVRYPPRAMADPSSNARGRALAFSVGVLLLVLGVTAIVVIEGPFQAPPWLGEFALSPEKPESGTSSEAVEVTLPPASLGLAKASDWIDVFEPGRAWGGYNLVLFKRRMPMLIDMNGRVVHSWPDVRAVGRARLLGDGHLVYIGIDDVLREVDWQGRLVREFRIGDEDYFPHHDFSKLDDGRLVAIYRSVLDRTDDVVFITPDGEVEWTWHSLEHLASEFTEEPFREEDLTHVNSVQVLPDNPWFRDGDNRFRPGNLLISARHLDAVYIVDRENGRIVWRYGTDLDWQHEAVMNGPHLPGAGHILIFNNRNHAAQRDSRVIELDPRDGRIVWSYSHDTFFTDIAGVAQKLPNGNVLITSSRGGRIFEVTPDGDVVWQWAPPYNPLRPQRYAYDHCPQLAGLAQPAEVGKAWTKLEPHIDRALYEFALRKGIVRVKVAGKRRKLLADSNACRQLYMPAAPVLSLGYGFATDGVASEAGRRGRIRLSVANEAMGHGEVLFERQVRFAESGSWTQQEVHIPRPYHDSRVELCIESSSRDLQPDDKPRGFVIAAPVIESALQRRDGDPTGIRTEKLHGRMRKQEEDLLERQLQAIGYAE